jgi:glycosyltransferase involved in cell wall biosynthesis
MSSRLPAPSRLLSINNYFYRRGGAEAIFLEQMRLFQEGGWDVVPFAMQHPDNLPSPWSEYFVSEIEYGRQPGLLTKLKHAGQIIYSNEAVRNLEALIARAPPAVAHAHNVYHHLSPSIFGALKRAGIPTVLTAHDLKLACPAYKMLSHGKVCEKCRGGHIQNVLLNRCVKESVALSGLVLLESVVHRAFGLYRNNVDRVVVPSRFYREKLIEWGWPAEMLTYVPNLVAVPEAANESPEGDYFAFVGRLAPEKGVATLIAAAARAGKRLVVAGSGPEEAQLRAAVESSGANVEFRGHVSGPALTDLLAGAKALVLPSEWYENAPVSILEAYALGRPVIGADIGGIAEMVRPGETGLLARSGDVEGLARALSEMDALGTKRRFEMGRAGRVWVAQDFSPEAYRERLISVYRQLGVAS